MNELDIPSDPRLNKIFRNYPEEDAVKMMGLRELVLETARETDDIDSLEETLKWGEPSYIVKGGSTLRMDWKPKYPHRYALYFKCTSRLVETFREIYGDRLEYEKNRAIVLQLNEELPVPELKSCIKAALRYHKVKQLPDLGIRG